MQKPNNHESGNGADRADVSVIVVNWNSGHLLAKCLQHLDAQTVQPRHILVVDNASSDDSAACANDHPNVTLYSMDANLGFAAGNNYAIEQCATEYIALLNPDAFPESDWLERLLAAVGSHPDVAAFGSRQLMHSSPDILDGIGDCYHLTGLVWRDRHGARQQAVDLIEKEIFSPCAAAALYRRQAVVDVGGFDEDYFCYVEDVDLGFRIRLAGHKAMYVPDAVVYHVGSATTGGQDSDFSVYHGHRNLEWTFIKNMPTALFFFLLPLHLAMIVMIVARFALRGQGRVMFQAKRDAIRGLPKAWSKRQKTQATRVATAQDIWRVLDKGMTRPKW